MSLAHSKGHPKGKGEEGWQLCSSRKSEKKARALSQPSAFDDKAEYTIHVNGNTKPSEPPYLQRRRSGITLQPRWATHIHAKPWSFCIATGKKENPHKTNPYHRVWIADAGRTGRVYDKVDEREDLGVPRRWNAARKKEHYDAYEAELNSLKPHDELYAIHTNVKFWTHLQDQGTHKGGQEKLEPIPARSTGLHMKHSIYRGKFDNVKHAQVVFKAGRKDKHNQPDEWQIDTRPAFDNRLHDDVTYYHENTDRTLSQQNYDIFRPLHTRSCPQMGADFMQR